MTVRVNGSGRSRPSSDAICATCRSRPSRSTICAKIGWRLSGTRIASRSDASRSGVAAPDRARERPPRCTADFRRAVEDRLDSSSSATRSRSHLDHLPRLFGRQRTEVHPDNPAAAPAVCRTTVGPVTFAYPVRIVATTSSPGIGPCASQLPAELLRRMVGPLDVLDPEERWPDRSRRASAPRSDGRRCASGWPQVRALRSRRCPAPGIDIIHARYGTNSANSGGELAEGRRRSFASRVWRVVRLPDVRKPLEQTDQRRERHRLLHLGADALEPAALAARRRFRRGTRPAWTCRSRPGPSRRRTAPPRSWPAPTARAAARVQPAARPSRPTGLGRSGAD